MRHPVGPSSSRYIFYPDHLVKLPSPADLTSPSGLLSTIQGVTNEPLFDGCFGAGLNLFTKTGSFSGLMPWRVDDRLESSLRKQQERWFGTGKGNNGDESVGAFLTRLFGGDDRPVRNLVSAVLHGIYGGDAWRLSAKHTILDRLWYQAAAPRPKDQVWMPRKDWFLLFELMDGGGPINANADAIVAMAERAVDGGWSLLAFEDGLVTLVRALVKDLQRRANVEVRTGMKADGLVAVDDGVVVRLIFYLAFSPFFFLQSVSMHMVSHLSVGIITNMETTIIRSNPHPRQQQQGVSQGRQRRNMIT